jgi:hypothetical protein
MMITFFTDDLLSKIGKLLLLTFLIIQLSRRKEQVYYKKDVNANMGKTRPQTDPVPVRLSSGHQGRPPLQIALFKAVPESFLLEVADSEGVPPKNVGFPSAESNSVIAPQPSPKGRGTVPASRSMFSPGHPLCVRLFL